MAGAYNDNNPFVNNVNKSMAIHATLHLVRLIIENVDTERKLVNLNQFDCSRLGHFRSVRSHLVPDLECGLVTTIEVNVVMTKTSLLSW